VPDSRELSENVSSLLIRAGNEIIVPAFKSQLSSTTTKADGSVVTETDLQCQRFLQSELSKLYPEIQFLGEEMEHEEQLHCLKSGGSFWCVDPLDGTTNFTVPLPHFALSIALITDGQPVFACIHDPLLVETFTASRGDGAKLNGNPIAAANADQLQKSVGFIDFKRLDTYRATVMATGNLYRSQRNIGTCALEWAWLAAGRAHFIVHGGEKVWDYAAGALLAEEAGCVVSDFDNRTPFHTPQLSSPITAACNRSIHRQLLTALQQADDQKS
jgi:myo-inositol-1(or 4)-monophosphatase